MTKLIEYKKDCLTDMRLDGGVGHGFSTEGRTCGHSSLASTPQNSTSAPLFRCPEPPFPHTPNHHLGCPILPFGVSHFTIWGILRRVYAPILAPFYPLFALISSHFRGKNGRQNVCLSPQLSGNQIPSHQCVTCKPVSEFLYLPLSIF